MIGSTIRKLLPAQEELRSCFDYLPFTGQLVRKRVPCDLTGRNQKIYQRRWLGKRAGGVSGGSIIVGINGKSYRAARVIWKLVYGTEPEDVDHIDGDPTNNRLANLRAATHQQNLFNQKTTKATNPRTGVSWDSHRKRWAAYIKRNGCRMFLGRYADLQTAIKVRHEAERNLFGRFAAVDSRSDA